MENSKEDKNNNQTSKTQTKKPRKKKFNHVGCFSYPICDLNPLGCFEQTPLEEIEPYGHRD
jgi:hypothetical protein